MVQAILRLYSYIFQAGVCLIFLALGAVAAMSDNTTFEIDMLQWSGGQLQTALLAMGAFGIVSVVLAYKGKLRILFLLWTLVTLYLLGRGIFASNHRFDGESEFKWALAMLLGVLLTVYGAWSRFRQPLGR